MHASCKCLWVASRCSSFRYINCDFFLFECIFFFLVLFAFFSLHFNVYIHIWYTLGHIHYAHSNLVFFLFHSDFYVVSFVCVILCIEEIILRSCLLYTIQMYSIFNNPKQNVNMAFRTDEREKKFCFEQQREKKRNKLWTSTMTTK